MSPEDNKSYCAYSITGSCRLNIQCHLNPNINGCVRDSSGNLSCSFNVLTSQTAINLQGTCGVNEIETALGCISYEVEKGGLIGSIMGLAVGLGGAGALVLMLYGFYLLTTSGGIPDKVKAGQEIITSAIGGLLFIIFATILMNLIGIKILALPGLE